MSWWAFFRGMGSVLDLSGSSFEPPRRYRTRHKTDAEALASDWDAVGEDFAMVMGDLDEAQEKALQGRPHQEADSKRRASSVPAAPASGVFRARPGRD